MKPKICFSPTHLPFAIFEKLTQVVPFLIAGHIIIITEEKQDVFLPIIYII